MCLGSSFGCAPPLLARVLGYVCACVRALLVPRHSWLGCPIWMCVLGLGFRLRPATPSWGSTRHDGRYNRPTGHRTPGPHTTTGHDKGPGNGDRGEQQGGGGGGDTKTLHNAAGLTSRRHRPAGQHTAQHTRQQRATAPRMTKHRTRQHGTPRHRTTPTKKGEAAPTADRQRRHTAQTTTQQRGTAQRTTRHRTTQHDNTAHSTTPTQQGTEKHRKTPRTTQDSPQQTEAPHNKTRDTANHEQPPGRGGGGQP